MGGVVCVIGGALLLWVAWRFAQLGGRPSVPSFLLGSSPLPWVQSAGYFAGLILAAVAVGRRWVSPVALLIAHVVGCLHAVDIGTTKFAESMFDARALLTFGIAIDLGRASILAGALCIALQARTQSK